MIRIERSGPSLSPPLTLFPWPGQGKLADHLSYFFVNFTLYLFTLKFRFRKFFAYLSLKTHSLKAI